MDLSIIIVTRNTSALLADCLYSIQSSCQTITYEIIVIDNGSTDDTLALLHRQFPAVQLIANDENKGFATANNQGIAIARGDFLLLLNSDTRVTNGALAKMIDYLSRHDDVGVLGAQLLNPNGTIQASCREFPSLLLQVFESTGLSRLFPGSRLFGRYRMGYWSHNTTRAVDQVMGAALMVRRTVVSQVGALDEQFFFYFDEVDWCYRIKKHGWKIVYLPDAKIIHLGGQTSRKEWQRVILSRYTGLRRFFKKHHPGWRQPVLQFLIKAEIMARMGAEATLRVIRPSERQMHTERIKGFVNVLRKGR